MPQQMLCAWLNGSPMLSAYCSQYHCVTLAGHVADGRPTTKRVTGWLTEYPCKLMIWEFEIDWIHWDLKIYDEIWEFEITIKPLNWVWMIIWFIKWKSIFQNEFTQIKKVLITCLTDTSVLYSAFLLILCFVCFSMVLFLE